MAKAIGAEPGNLKREVKPERLKEREPLVSQAGRIGPDATSPPSAITSMPSLTR
jgi:hypothetical protein